MDCGGAFHDELAEPGLPGAVWGGLFHRLVACAGAAFRDPLAEAGAPCATCAGVFHRLDDCVGVCCAKEAGVTHLLDAAGVGA